MPAAFASNPRRWLRRWSTTIGVTCWRLSTGSLPWDVAMRPVFGQSPRCRPSCTRECSGWDWRCFPRPWPGAAGPCGPRRLRQCSMPCKSPERFSVRMPRSICCRVIPIDWPRRGVSIYGWPLWPVCWVLGGSSRAMASPRSSLAGDSLPSLRRRTDLGARFHPCTGGAPGAGDDNAPGLSVEGIHSGGAPQPVGYHPTETAAGDELPPAAHGGRARHF